MNCFRYKILLLASMASAGHCSSDTTMLRGSTITTIPFEKDNASSHQHRRRHLMKGLTCQLYRKDVAYGPTEEYPDGYQEETWACKLPKEESSASGLQYFDIADAGRILKPSENNAIVSGQASLELSEAIIEEDAKMYIPETATVRIGESNFTDGEIMGRNLAPASSNLYLPTKALMIRIIDSNDVQSESSAEDLKNAIYENESSFKAQMDACSYNKMTIEPFSGSTQAEARIEGGITDLQIDYAVDHENNAMNLDNAIFEAVSSQLGDVYNDGNIDLVMFCLPPKTHQNVIAYHLAGTKFSFFGHQWCSSTSALMHLVGRTMGLEQSNSLRSDGGIIVQYGDKTGMMGGLGKISKRCYNPAKSHQLGWYRDQTRTLNPLRGSARTASEFVLNGVSDYGKNPDSALVVLKLKQINMAEDYYIGFNKATGINSETPMDQNKITILRAEAENGHTYGTSTRIAALHPGQHHILSNYDGRVRRDVAIRFVGLLNENAIVQVVDLKNTPEWVADEFFVPETNSCSNYQIQVTTDGYPKDTSWAILENGGSGQVYASSPVYTEPETTTTTTVCLPGRDDGVQYKFQLFDDYGDGFQGSYNGFDPNGRHIFERDASTSIEEGHLFDSVVLDEETIDNADKPCKNKRGTFKWKANSNKKRGCSWIAKRKKCNVRFEGDPLWKLCPRACNKCNLV